MGLALGRVALALVVAGALIALACAGLYVTSAPALLSLAIEPGSLLLLPGLAVALATAGARDYSPRLTVEVSFAFYAVMTYAMLWWGSRRARYARRGSR